MATKEFRRGQLVYVWNGVRRWSGSVMLDRGDSTVTIWIDDKQIAITCPKSRVTAQPGSETP